MMRLISTLCVTVAVICFTPLPSARADPPQPDKPWRLTVSAGVGYNDNVAALEDRLTIDAPASTVPFISSRHSATGRFTFDFSYDLIADNTQILTAGYRMHGDIYESDASEFNEHDHFIWAGYQRKLADQLVASAILEYAYANVDGDSVRDAYSIQPSLTYALSDWLTVELGGLIEFSDYKTPLPFGGSAAAARDGETYGIGPTFYIDVPGTELKVLLAYGRRWNQTEGGAYDFDEDRVTVGVSHPLPLKIQGDFRYSHLWQEYDGLGPRDDEADLYSIYLTRPLCPRATLYLRYDHVDNESNGALFEYRQNVVAAGVIVTF